MNRSHASRRLARLAALALCTGALCVGTLLPATGETEGVWGNDINAGDGPALAEKATPGLAAILAAPEEERTALAESWAASDAPTLLEAVKRFRNPELLPLFRALARSGDWKCAHRGLLALEYMDDPEALPIAVSLLTHQERRLRERAAIACIALWDAKAGKAALGGDPAKAVRELALREPDLHVASCLEALGRRIAGKLPVEQVHVEHVEEMDGGLLWTPFLSGMNTVRKVAPSYKKKGYSGGGGGKASKCDPAGPWTTPLLAYEDEVVKGTSLQPFANLRGGGKTYHTGQDVGASLDGAGYYAAAEGFVRFIHGGSDMGTMLVVQHLCDGGLLVNAVYMHGGVRVFVKGGERVKAGQLLGTMGLSYSIENGGHYAHLHYGLYPGGFVTTHNYGYKPVSRGLADWIDPAKFLRTHSELNGPLVPRTPASNAVPAAAADAMRAGQWKKARAALEKAGADTAVAAIDRAVADVPARAARIRALGYPTRASEFLKASAKALAGLPGADAIAAAAKEWKKDATLKTDLKAEKALLKAMAAGMTKGPKDAKAIYERLLADVEGTCVVPRAKILLDDVQPR